MNEPNRENRWTPPSDRALTLRAKLMSGWSVRSAATTNLPTTPTSLLAAQHEAGANGTTATNKPTVTHCQISELEQEVIRNVIARAQLSEQVEKERITRLVDRLNNIKRNAAGDGGRSRCALCNEKYNLFIGQGHRCTDCRKLCCNKCAVDTISLKDSNQVVWLCKICSETRETWKKSGAWFLGAFPTHYVRSSSSATSSPSTSRQSPSVSLSNLPSSTAISPISVDSQPFERSFVPSADKVTKVQNSQHILARSPVVRRRKAKTQSVHSINRSSQRNACSFNDADASN